MNKENMEAIHLPQIPQLQKSHTLQSNTSRKSLESYLLELKLQQISLKKQQTSRK